MTLEEKIQELEDGMTVVQQKFSQLMVENAELKSKLVLANAALAGEKHRVKQLRDGLSVYLPGPFWDEVIAYTKADEDRGKHAEWVLRATAEADDAAGA